MFVRTCAAWAALAGGVALGQAPGELPPAPAVGSPSPVVQIQAQGGGPNASGPGGSPAPAGATDGSSTASTGPSFMPRWNNGLFFESPTKDFTAHVGGAVHFDSGFYDAARGLEVFPNAPGAFLDGAFVRRGRLFAEGTMYKNFAYRFEVEFFNGFRPAGNTDPAAIVSSVFNSPGPTDAWMQMTDIPLLGTVRVGQQKEPFSLEHLESYRFLTFIERSYLFDSTPVTGFNNGFSPGVSAFNTSADERLFGQVGLFKNTNTTAGFGTGDGEYAVTGRLAYLLDYNPAERHFWSVGGAMSHRDPVNDRVQVRIRDQVRGGPVPFLNLIANTGLIVAGSNDDYNLETAAVVGPLSLQAEYTANVVNGAFQQAVGPQGGLLFQGFYAQTSFLLTGESRTWNTKSATYNRVVPRRNFGFNGGGPGAIELAARYSYYDASDKAVRGGKLDTYTLGLNWYLNPNMKLQFNYDYTFVSDG